MFPKPKRKTDRKFLDFVSTNPCQACGRRGPSDPHHITSRKAGGGDTPDNVMPLCRQCHTRWHKEGVGRFIQRHPSIETWLREHGREDVLEKVWARNLRKS